MVSCGSWWRLSSAESGGVEHHPFLSVILLIGIAKRQLNLTIIMFTIVCPMRISSVLLTVSSLIMEVTAVRTNLHHVSCDVWIDPHVAECRILLSHTSAQLLLFSLVLLVFEKLVEVLWADFLCDIYKLPTFCLFALNGGPFALIVNAYLFDAAPVAGFIVESQLFFEDVLLVSGSVMLWDKLVIVLVLEDWRFLLLHVAQGDERTVVGTVLGVLSLISLIGIF